VSEGRENEVHIDKIAQAMREFVDRGDGKAFEHAVADYVRAARERKLPVEQVLGELEAIADTQERHRLNGLVILDRTELRKLILRGVLLAFYGAEVMALRESESAERQPERRAPERRDRRQR
jgi:hypothetical protein